LFPEKLPTAVIACVGGGSNAMGLFQGFLDCDAVKMIGAEAGGHGLEGHAHAARLAGHRGKEGIAHGYRTYFLQDEDGQMRDTHSVAAGLDYVGVSPILSYLSDIGRLETEAPTDVEVIAALQKTIRREGIIPALESSHALAAAYGLAITLPKSARLLVSLSGRGDKDIFTIAEALHDPAWEDFIMATAERYNKQRSMP
jgi:tryptophan synthase beta chain